MTESADEKLDFRCAACNKRLRAKVRMAGHTLACPRCGEPVTVPGKRTESTEKHASSASTPSAHDDFDFESVFDDSPSPGTAATSGQVPPDARGSMAPSASASKDEPSSSPKGSDVSSSSGWPHGEAPDPLRLETPAIDDLSDRQLSAEEIKAQKAKTRSNSSRRSGGQRGPSGSRPSQSSAPRSGNRGAKSATAAKPPLSERPADQEDDELRLQDESTDHGRRHASNSPNKSRSPSLFDDDLPELAEEQPNSHRKKLDMEAILEAQGLDALADVDLESIDQADLEEAMRDQARASASDSEAFHTDERRQSGERTDSSTRRQSEAQRRKKGSGGQRESDGDRLVVDNEYRIACDVCGTPQYVTPRATGTNVTCPDCLCTFQVPPPPDGWKPKQRKRRDYAGGTNDEMVLSGGDDDERGDADIKRKSRTSAMLAKAKQQMAEEQKDGLPEDLEFDLPGFVQSTFGLFKDPVTLAFICGYGIVFALVFGLVQLGLSNVGRGYVGQGIAFACLISAPLVAFMFGMPMMSAGLALLESVANRQRRVEEWPGFDMFEHFGDLLAIFLTLIASFVPGFLLAGFFSSGMAGTGLITLGGGLLGTFLLFPVLLLSILDNGSLFQPISDSVLKSIPAASEAWGGYYLKTFSACAVTMLLWVFLLGNGILGTAVGGFFAPMLFFFTFQQLGALADNISENLSFEFTPPDEDQKGEATG